MRLRCPSVFGVLVLFAALALSGPAGALAQATPDASPAVSPEVPPAFDLSRLAGLQMVVARGYAADTSTLLATPASVEATPDSSSFGVVNLSAIIFRFGSEAEATDGFAGVVAQVTSPANTGGIDLKEVPIAGFSENTKGYAASIDQGPGLSLNQAVLVTQDGAFIYETIVISLTSTDDAMETAANATTAMVEAPVGEGEGTLSKDGTSSGGIWEKFPKAGDPVLRGMKPEMDDQVFPKL